ncbi:2928_t:CDS:2 [Entrophospora sp. SA101]|nr:2928_t:CDS:2 [Entrophospora sp. SA101]
MGNDSTKPFNGLFSYVSSLLTFFIVIKLSEEIVKYVALVLLRHHQLLKFPATDKAVW